MNTLLVIVIIILSSVSIGAIVYYLDIVKPVRKEQKYWNPYTRTFDTKPKEKDWIRKFK